MLRPAAHVQLNPNKVWFMLERAVRDTERGDTEPGTAVVFML
jgi:hypothetical protein